MDGQQFRPKQQSFTLRGVEWPELAHRNVECARCGAWLADRVLIGATLLEARNDVHGADVLRNDSVAPQNGES